MTDLIKAARFNTMNFGFHVFPLHGITPTGECTCGDPSCGNSRGKHPLHKEWQSEATIDLHKIESMFKNDNCNMGIKTGADSDCWVLDIDGEQGEKDLLSLQNIHGKLPQTLTAKTSKGRHIYFKHPGFDVPNKVRISPQIDIRGDGGLVVSPPSKHYSGCNYEWVNPLDGVEPAPQWLLDILKANIAQKSTIVHNTSDFALPSFDQKLTEAEVREMLSFLDPKMKLNDGWLAVGMALHSGGYPYDLWEQWSTGNGIAPKPGECAYRYSTFTAGGGVSMGSLWDMCEDKGWVRPERFRKGDNHQALSTSPTASALKEEVKTFKLTDWIASERYIGTAAPIRWLVEGIFPLGVPCLLAAMGGLGKSFIALDMAIKIATPCPLIQQKILGHEIKEFGKVVFLTAEDSFESIHRRINKLVTGDSLEATKDNLIIIPMSSVDISQLLVREGRNGLEMTEIFHEIKNQLMEIKDLKLVAIDPLQAFVGADITSKPEAAQFMWSAFAKIAAQTGASFLATHHMRKDGTAEIKTAADARESIRGTTGLVDGARVAYVMWQTVKEVGETIARSIDRKYEAHRYVQGAVVKANDEADHAVMSFYREESGVLSCHGTVDTSSSAKKVGTLTANQDFIYRAILDSMIDFGVSIVVYPGQRPIRCITYKNLYAKLDKMGYKTFLTKGGEPEDDPQKMVAKIRNSTTNARVALKDKGKINFNGDFIWVIADGGLSADSEPYDIDSSKDQF